MQRMRFDRGLEVGDLAFGLHRDLRVVDLQPPQHVDRGTALEGLAAGHVRTRQVITTLRTGPRKSCGECAPVTCLA